MIVTGVDIDAIKASLIIIVIQPDNLERMHQHDPITLETRKAGGVLPVVKYPENLNLLIAYEEQDQELLKIVDGGSIGDLIEFLRRGYKFIRGLDGTHLAYKINDPKTLGEHN